MKKIIKFLVCFVFAVMVAVVPMNVGSGRELATSARQLILLCTESITHENQIEALSINTSKAPHKSLQATADASIKYSSLNAVNPVSAPTNLDDFTVATNGTVSTSGGTLSYSRKVKVQATAYCSCSICCGPYDGTSTADGSRPKPYYTVAASKLMPFGTMLYIPYFDSSPNNGVFEVEDRGGAIQNNRIDVYFATHQEALRFGRRSFYVYILK